MSYDLSKVSGENQGGDVSPYLSYGSNQELFISAIELKPNRAGDSVKPILHMEGRPIIAPGFSPVDGAKGKVGKVSATYFIKDDKGKTEFLQKMKVICISLGLEDEVNKIKSETFDGVVQQIEKLIKGSDNLARYTIFAEEYTKQGGKTGITLSLPKFGFVDSLESDGSSLVQFDKNNNYHYKKIQTQAPTSVPLDDLPF